MKNILLFLLLSTVFFSCKNDNDNMLIDNSPKLSLDSLKALNTNIPNAIYSDLTFINEMTGFAIAEGFIVKTTDGGITWTQVNLPVSTPVKKIQFTDNQTGFIIGGDNTFGILFKTTDCGQNWITYNLNALECPYGMFFINNNTGFITGKNLFIRTDDGGQTWRSLKSDVFRMYQDVSFRNDKEGIVTSSNGVYFKTTNGGNSWDNLKVNYANFLYDIYFVDNKTYVVQSSDSLVDINRNYAVTIKPQSSKKLLFFNSMQCIAIGSHYEQGFYPYGDIFITNDGWKNFNQKTFSTVDAISFTAIAKMNDNKIMIIGAGFTGTKVIVLKK